MENKGTTTKILAGLGTVLVLLPVLAPVFFGFASLIESGQFRFDYLMPAELFPVILVGAALLLWAAIRARSYLKLIGWSLGIAVVIPIIGQVIASVTGLASGDTEPGGWEWALVLASLAVLYLAIITTGIGGILLEIDLFKQGKSAPNKI